MTIKITTQTMTNGTLTGAAAQWASRPADERFLTLEAGLEAAIRHHRASRVAPTRLADLTVAAQGDEVVLVGKRGQLARLTHHAFGQVAARAGAPAAYLRKLPAQLAADCIADGLAKRETAEDDSDARLLLRVGEGGLRAHAITSERYARVWDAEVMATLVDLVERQPWWQHPIAHRSAARVTGTGTGTATWGADTGKVMPCVFVSDHDMFVFLVDYDHPVERRDADGGVTMLFRGFWVENSEVGAGSFRVVAFLFDAVCANLMIWGVRDVLSITRRHVGSIRDEVLGTDSRILAGLTSWAQRPASADAEIVARAQRTLVADTQAEVVSTLLGRRIPGLTESALDAAAQVCVETPRYGDPRSVWGVVSGLTEVSQRTPHADTRVALDRAAGKVLEIAF